jgi:hypothetical protein
MLTGDAVDGGLAVSTGSVTGELSGAPLVEVSVEVGGATVVVGADFESLLHAPRNAVTHTTVRRDGRWFGRRCRWFTLRP